MKRVFKRSHYNSGVARGPVTATLILLVIVLSPLDSIAQRNSDELLEQAAALIRSNRLAEAETQLNNILKLKPDESLALNLLGTIRGSQGRLDEAEALFARALQIDSKLIGARMNLAYLYLLKKQPERTVTELKEVLRLDPDYTEAREKLARLLLSLGRVDECIALVENSQRTASPGLLVVAGDAWLKKPDLFEAERVFRRAIELQPDNPQVQMYLGYTLMKQKKYPEARALLEKSTKTDPSRPEPLYYLGLIAQEQNEDARAVEIMEKLAKQFPAFANAHIALGSAYMKLRDYSRARQELELAVKLDPDEPKAHYNLAMLYARLKDPQRAQEEMQIVERLKNGNRSAKETEIFTPPAINPR